MSEEEALLAAIVRSDFAGFVGKVLPPPRTRHPLRAQLARGGGRLRADAGVPARRAAADHQSAAALHKEHPPRPLASPPGCWGRTGPRK